MTHIMVHDTDGPRASQRSSFPRPRFSILALLSLICTIAIILGFISYFLANRKHDAVVLARLTPVNPTQYGDEKAATLKTLRSRQFANVVAASLQQKGTRVTTEQIRDQLTVDMPGNGEIIRITITERGQTNQEKAIRIADEVAVQYKIANPNVPFTIVQTAVISKLGW